MKWNKRPFSQVLQSKFWALDGVLFSCFFTTSHANNTDYVQKWPKMHSAGLSLLSPTSSMKSKNPIFERCRYNIMAKLLLWLVLKFSFIMHHASSIPCIFVQHLAAKIAQPRWTVFMLVLRIALVMLTWRRILCKTRWVSSKNGYSEACYCVRTKSRKKLDPLPLKETWNVTEQSLKAVLSIVSTTTSISYPIWCRRSRKGSINLDSLANWSLV